MLHPYVHLHVLHHLHANLCRKIVCSDNTYKSIAEAHDRVQVFTIGSMLIRVQFARFPLGNVEVLHIQFTNPFRFLRENVIAPLESNILSAFAIHSVFMVLTCLHVLFQLVFELLSMHNILHSNRFSACSTSFTSTIATTIGTLDSWYLVLVLLDLYIFGVVERFTRN